MEIDGAPDLTTLTHSRLSLLASCALWFIQRGHTHTHIYLSMHAGDERILGLYVCSNVSAYQNMLKRVDATNKILLSVFVVYLNLYAHMCVCMFTCLLSGLVPVSICFWCSVSPYATPSSQSPHRVSPCASRLRSISCVEHKLSN